MYAPIALFVYNRPEHSKRALYSLLSNDLAKDSELYVFSDGPRSIDDEAKVQVTRALFKNLRGFKKVTLIPREDNNGLASNIINGVTTLLRQYESVIVLEDDLIVSKYFLAFMNESLEKYKDVDKVCCIHGYCFPTKQPLPTNFFLKGADCWGWATWRHEWSLFEADGQKLLDELASKRLNHVFDLDGTVPYTRVLKDQVAQKNHSWAIRWYAVTFLKDKLCLFPGKSLVHNIGMDSSGQHCESTDVYVTELATSPVQLVDIPLTQNNEAREIIKAYYKSTKRSLLTRIVAKAKRTLFAQAG